MGMAAGFGFKHHRCSRWLPTLKRAGWQTGMPWGFEVKFHKVCWFTKPSRNKIH